MIPHSASFLKQEDFAFVRGVVERNFVGRGPLCEELTLQLAARFARPFVTLTDSGTAAIRLALLALKELHPAGQRVLVSAYLCPQVLSTILQCGLEATLIDTCSNSMNLDVGAAAAAIDRTALSIICTHVGGRPDDLAGAALLGIPVISDCAQGVGSQLQGLDVASAGICSVLSFGATKLLTVGSGGALLTSDQQLAEIVARLARIELDVDEYQRGGFRATWGQHVNELTAGLALAQLRGLDDQIRRRREIALHYTHALQGRSGLAFPSELELVRSNCFRYYFLSDEAKAWMAHLRSKDIDARASIAHVLPHYLDDPDAFPSLSRSAERLVSVPLFPAMAAHQVRWIVDALISETCA